jgi:alcohol dehydrogenase
MLGSFDLKTDTRVVAGEGTLEQLGRLAKELGFTRTLLVADAGLAKAGHLEHAHRVLSGAGIEALEFSNFGPNPDADMVEAGRAYAAGKGIDSLVGLGGGSSLDCAKGINFLLTQGGAMRDFQGYGKASKPMLPMIGVPTTAGTGSEAQSYAIISDPTTHQKMACGDPQAAFRAVILDPRLTLTQPASVTAAAGYDAIAHAVETYVSTKRNPRSEMLSREAWRLLEIHYERVLRSPGDLDSRAAMQLGAYYAGMAIELSMLGATHACANPLSARYGTTHGDAIAILLPHVVRWNGGTVGSQYGELLRVATLGRNSSSNVANADNAGEALASRLEELAAAGGLPAALRNVGASSADLPALAQEASEQWTGRFNPRPFDTAGAREVYECAY